MKNMKNRKLRTFQEKWFKIISVNLSLKMLRIGKHLNKSVSQILKKMQNQTIKWNGTNKKSVLSNRFYFAKFV